MRGVASSDEMSDEEENQVGVPDVGEEEDGGGEEEARGAIPVPLLKQGQLRQRFPPGRQPDWLLQALERDEGAFRLCSDEGDPEALFSYGSLSHKRSNVSRPDELECGEAGVKEGP